MMLRTLSINIKILALEEYWKVIAHIYIMNVLFTKMLIEISSLPK